MKTSPFSTLTVAFLFFATNFVATCASGAIFLDNEQLIRSHVFAADNRFQSVGAVNIRKADGTVSALGSGVLISRDWVLTAGHVGLDINTGTGRTGLSFNLGLNSNNPFHTVNATVHAIHPRYVQNGFFPQIGDLALLKLVEPITIVVPAERFRGVDPPLGFSNPPQQYFMAGYGVPGVVLPGDNRRLDGFVGDELKRAGSNNGSSVGNPLDYDAIITRFNASSRFDPNIDLEWNGSPGDSGGGMFMDVNGQFQLAGTITGASTSFLGGSARTAIIRSTLFNDWIDQQITAVPEPSTLAMVGFAATTGFIIRKRSNRMMDQSARQGRTDLVTSPSPT